LLISPEIDNRVKVVPRVLYVINAGTRRAPQLVRKLVELDIQLTVTVGRDEKLHRAIEKAAGNRKIDIFGWTDEMPRLLCGKSLLMVSRWRDRPGNDRRWMPDDHQSRRFRARRR